MKYGILIPLKILGENVYGSLDVVVDTRWFPYLLKQLSVSLKHLMEPHSMEFDRYLLYASLQTFKLTYLIRAIGFAWPGY